jgi:hypothetical protein
LVLSSSTVISAFFVSISELDETLRRKLSINE